MSFLVHGIGQRPEEEERPPCLVRDETCARESRSRALCANLVYYAAVSCAHLRSATRRLVRIYSYINGGYRDNSDGNKELLK